MTSSAISHKRNNTCLNEGQPSEDTNPTPAKRARTETSSEERTSALWEKFSGEKESGSISQSAHASQGMQVSLLAGTMQSEQAGNGGSIQQSHFNPETLAPLTSSVFRPSLSEQGPAVVREQPSQTVPVLTSQIAQPIQGLPPAQLFQGDALEMVLKMRRPPTLPMFATYPKLDSYSAPALPANVPSQPSSQGSSSGGEKIDYESEGLEALEKKEFERAKELFQSGLKAKNFQAKKSKEPQEKEAQFLNYLGLAQLGLLGKALLEDAYDFEGFFETEFVGEYEQAITNFTKALECDFSFSVELKLQVRFNMATALWCRNRDDDRTKAIKVLEDAFDAIKGMDPDPGRFFIAKMYHQLGMFYAHQEMWQQAVDRLSRGIRLHFYQDQKSRFPGDPYKGNLLALSELDLGKVCMETNNAEHAAHYFGKVEVYKELISNRSIIADFYFHLGLLIERTGGDLEQALNFYEAGVAQDFDQPDLKGRLLYQLARLQADLKKDNDRTIDLCTDALALQIQDSALLADLHALEVSVLVRRGVPEDIEAAIDSAEVALELDLSDAQRLKFVVTLAELNQKVEQTRAAALYYADAAGIEDQSMNEKVSFFLKAVSLLCWEDDFDYASDICEEAHNLLIENVHASLKAQVCLDWGGVFMMWADDADITSSKGLQKRKERLTRAQELFSSGMAIEGIEQTIQAKLQEKLTEVTALLNK